MNEQLYKSFKIMYPDICDQAVNIHDNGKLELEIELEDGRVALYDHIDDRLRILPNDSNNMTKQECLTEFGFRLKRTMLFKGINQITLSEITGISQPTINGYINGTINPTFYNVDKIAKALRCSMDELRYF